jgi:zinc protease
MLNRTQAPPIIDAADLNLQLKPSASFTLKNGVQVYSIDAGAEEVLQIEWVFYAGNWYEEKNMIATTANFMLKNGTSKKNAFQINEHFEYYGSYLNRSCYNETSTVNIHCLNKHIGELLPVIRELLTDSIFPEEELNTFKQNQLQRLAVSLKKSDFVAGRLIDTYLFGEEHPYGRFTKEEHYQSLTTDDLKKFYNNYYRQGKCIIFVAGKIPANMESLLNQYFGDLPIGQNDFIIPNIEPKPAAGKGEKRRIQNDPNGVQGSIRIAREFPNRHHPDFMKVQVLNNLFGGFFGSRLMSNIREDKGYTYGIYSYLQNHMQTSAWAISTEAGKDVCEATIDEVYKEMKMLREELVDDEEMQLVRNYMMGSILGDLDGPFQIIARWKNIILNNLDEKYFYDSLKTIKTITPEELKALAEKYFKPEDFYELVVI